MKNGKKLKITERDGFSGVEITVALVVLMIFISLIAVTFFNIYSVYTDSKRGSEATAYATQIMEQVQKMYYSEVTDQKLAEKVLEMNIPQGYSVQIQVENYNEEDLVKNVVISVNYKVGKQEKNVRFETVKAREILITPNKPKLETGMVPVKYVITDRDTNEGYWQITAENDSTWYSYENKKWAAVMRLNNLSIEGEIQVTEENMKNLIGKKVENFEQILVWIPRFAYSKDDIVFLYNITDNYIDENGDMQSITKMKDYTVHQAFESITGVWTDVYDDTAENVEKTLENSDSEKLQATRYLVNSKYGDIINIIKNKVW